MCLARVPVRTPPKRGESGSLLDIHGDVVAWLLANVAPASGPRHGPLDHLALVAPAPRDVKLAFVHPVVVLGVGSGLWFFEDRER